jgi:hypothetical protein
MTPNQPSEDHLVGCLLLWSVIMAVLIGAGFLFVYYTVPTIVGVGVFVGWICLSVEKDEGPI